MRALRATARHCAPLRATARHCANCAPARQGACATASLRALRACAHGARARLRACASARPRACSPARSARLFACAPARLRACTTLPARTARLRASAPARLRACAPQVVRACWSLHAFAGCPERAAWRQPVGSKCVRENRDEVAGTPRQTRHRDTSANSSFKVCMVKSYIPIIR